VLPAFINPLHPILKPQEPLVASGTIFNSLRDKSTNACWRDNRSAQRSASGHDFSA